MKTELKNLLQRMAILFALGLQTTRAVEVDLAGAAIGNGAKFSKTSAGTVPAGLIYDVAISGTGTSTGTFTTAFGDGDYATLLDNLLSGSSDYLHFTVLNRTGKLPVNFLKNKPLSLSYSNVTLAPGVVAAQLKFTGTTTLGIDASGKVKFAAKFKLKAQKANGDALPITGNYTFTSGAVTLVPSVATSETPQPNLLVATSTHFTTGNNVIDSNGATNITFLRAHRGSSATQYYVVKNNGPAADGLLLSGLPGRQFLPTGITTRVYDVTAGNTDITDQVYSANSYAVKTAGGADLPSGGTKLIKMVIQVGAQANLTSIFSPDHIELKLRRTADSANFTVGGDSLIVLK